MYRYIYTYIYIYTPSDLANLQQTTLSAYFKVISNASVDILQNGWPEICCDTLSKQETTQQN